MNSQDNELNLHLHPRQWEAYLSPASEILYGGAVGGGKSILIRFAAIMYAASIPGLQVYLFRRIHEDLIKNHVEGIKGFRNLLSGWVACGLCEIVDEEIRFWNGSKIYLCHCQLEKHRFKYQGAEIHLLLIDELTLFTEVIYRFLRSRVRVVGLDIPEGFKKQFPKGGRIICGSNPGNIGHGWVKATFVDHGQEVWQTSDEEGGRSRQYIPAKMADNPNLLEDDPNYVKSVRGLGNPELVRAMESGDWDVIAGAFFSMWDSKRHVIKRFSPPISWLRFTSSDWGYAKPFSTGWWAIVDEPFRVETSSGDFITLKKGCLVRYKEWYGCDPKQVNTGLKLSVSDWAKGVVKRSEYDDVKYNIADTSMFSEDGGESMAETARKLGLYLKPTDKKRIAGWQQLINRLYGDEEFEAPMIVFMDNCRDTIRTVPALQHNEFKVEDLDTDMEDHAADEIRYACMSRPRPIAGKEPSNKPKYGTMSWLIAETTETPQSKYKSL